MRNDVQSIGIRHDAQRFHQRLESEKRFACSHTHEIDAARRLHSNAIGIIQRAANLLDDFAGGQGTQQAQLCRQTEAALQRTTRLG